MFLRKISSLVTLLALAWHGGVLADEHGPNASIESAIAELTTALDGRKDELTANSAELYALVDGILLPRFDRKYAAQLVLGRHWRSADDAERSRFIDAFYQSLRNKYADGVLEFQQDKVELLAFRGDATKQRTMVRTVVYLNDGQKVPVNYGMVKRDAGWMIFDVTIEGVSYIRNYRAELDAEIRATSLAAVIERFENEAGIATGG